jgi:outer membrane protein OmpA-like peptidoglycan-associated protein
MGGRDIYVTTKDEKNGQWKPLESLGKKINTKFDEDAPFLTPDGNTLYFASNGHNSMGDYDIFKTVLNEQGEWSAVENLGPPINTPGHDRYFITSDDGAIGYYASDRDGGYGETDIYRIILDCKAVSATMINGVVYSEDLQKPVATTITIFDPATNVKIRTFKTDSVTGKYEMRLKTETSYGFLIDANGYLPHSGEFTVPKQCDYFSLFQEIKIENLEDSAGRVYAQRASINNAFFNVDQKLEEDFEGMDIAAMDEVEKDSLRSIVAKDYNPIELTNYIQLIDIVDPNGVRLAHQKIGDVPVSKIQTRDEVNFRYDDRIALADKQYYSEHLPEARANYMIASEIKPEEVYAAQQIEIIDAKLYEAPFAASMSSMPEEDKSELVPPMLVDSATLDIAAHLGDQHGYDASSLDNDVAELHRLGANDGKLDYTEETGELGDQEIDGQGALDKDAAELHQLGSEDVKLDYTEETGELGEQEVSPQADMENEKAKMEDMEEDDSGLSIEEEEETIVFRNILFDFDKSDLRKKSISELNKVSTYMSKTPGVEVQIDGHADWIGTVGYNMALSEKRAKAAYAYLTKDKKIGENRLSYQYFGEAVPIAPNENADGSDNPDGRQLNRRCEFKIDQSGTAENVVLKF